MWKQTFFLCVGISSCIFARQIEARPTCDSVFASCDAGGATATYGGYFCQAKANNPSRTAAPQPGQVVQAVSVPNPNNPGTMQCGDLYSVNTDPVTQQLVLVLVSRDSCGGDQGANNCDQPSQG